MSISSGNMEADHHQPPLRAAGRLLPPVLPLGKLPEHDSSSLSSSVARAAKLCFLLKRAQDNRFCTFCKADKSFFLFQKTHVLRRWATRLVNWRWFERMCLVVIAINCISIAMINPCELNTDCTSIKCLVLEIVDAFVSVFFLFEMLVKMLANCAVGHRSAYLANPWNRLDFVIVLASIMEYGFASQTSSNWTLIRVIRILRPIRAIKRIPSLRLLVTLLCDTLPALSSVIALIIFIYFIFGIIGVQLWSGVLRHRCYLNDYALAAIEGNGDITIGDPNNGFNFNNAPIKSDVFRFVSSDQSFDVALVDEDDADDRLFNRSHSFSTLPPSSRPAMPVMPLYYKSLAVPDYTCGGLLQCGDIPHFEKHHSICETIFEDDAFHSDSDQHLSDRLFCKKMIENNSYSKCRASNVNPLNGGISFDNIFVAFITIFQAVSPEGWSDIMYIVQDAYSFWAWPYFVILIAMVTFGVSNLSFIIVAVQIPQTKRKLAKKMKAEAEEAKKKQIQSSVTNWFSVVVDKQMPIVNLAGVAVIKPSKNWQQRLKAVVETAEKQLKKRPILPTVVNKDESLNVSEVAIQEANDEKRNFYTLLVDVTVDFIRERLASVRTLSQKATDDEDETSNMESSVDKTLMANNVVSVSSSDHPIITDDCEDDESSAKKRHHRDRRPPSACKSRMQACWQKLHRSREISRLVATHLATTIFISAAIVVNTVFLAAEHHNQPQTLTSIVEWMNIVFTILFTIELIVKMYAFGFVSYIRDGFNMLDFIIVIISLADLMQGSGSRLSVLRTFRLLRIIKLLRVMPAMQEQLVALFKTVNSVAPFLVLFALFLFIFCVLGMSLFGCKYCDDSSYYLAHTFSNYSNSLLNFNNKSVVSNLSLHFTNRTCLGDSFFFERHNDFDSLLSSLLSVLKILTQDDGWSDILRSTMFLTSSNWPAMYFVCLVMFGNYVILSMLLAIIDVGSSPTAARIIRHQQTSMRFTATKNPRQSEGTTQSEADTDELERRSTRRSSYSKAMQEPVTNIGSPDKRSMSSYKIAIENNPISSPMIAARRQRVKRQQQQQQSGRSSTSSNMSIYAIRRRPSYQMAVTQYSDEKMQDWLTFGEKSPRSSLFSTDDEPINRILSPALSASPLRHHHRTRNRWGLWRTSFNESEEGYDSTSLTSVFESECSAQMPTVRRSHRHSRRRANDLIKVAATNHRRRNHSTGANNSPKPLRRQPRSLPKIVIEDVDSPVGNSPRSPKIDPSTSEEDDRSVIAIVSQPLNVMATTVQIASVQPQENWRHYSLFLFSTTNPVRKFLIWLTNSHYYDKVMLVIVAASCVSVMLERPAIEPDSIERQCLYAANYFFSAVFFTEAVIKIIALGFVLGVGTYLRSGWNIMDFVLVVLSLADLAVEFGAYHGATTAATKAFRALRLLRTFRPLRAINRTPGLKVVTRMLGTSIKSIANVIFICGIFYVAFAVLGLQMLRGCFYRCVVADGDDSDGDEIASIDRERLLTLMHVPTTAITKNQSGYSGVFISKHSPSHASLLMHLEHVQTRNDCLAIEGLEWENPQHNFDNFLESLRALMVVATFDGWIEITQNGLNCVGVDQQPVDNYNPWRLVFFLTFLVLIGFCVVEMFVGVICNNYRHMKVQLAAEEAEEAGEAEDVAKTPVGSNKRERVPRRLLSRRGGVRTLSSTTNPVSFWLDYPTWRRKLYHVCSHFYLDIGIALLIVANIVAMAAEHYMMPRSMVIAFRYLNYFFTSVFTVEIIAKLIAFGVRRYTRNRWNQLDIAVCVLSIAGIVLEEIGTARLFPVINPKIVRIIRVVRVVRALKLLKVAKGVQQLLDMVKQALPQVANLSLFFLLLFFIYASLGVELLGRIECPYNRCEGLSRHANFHNFGMALLTLFRISTGDKWEDIMEDVLKVARNPKTSCFGVEYIPEKDADEGAGDGTASQGNDCGIVIALTPFYFTSFYVSTQFFLVNVIVAVLMNHLEEAEKQGLLQAADALIPREMMSSFSSEEDDKDAHQSTAEEENNNEKLKAKTYSLGDNYNSKNAVPPRRSLLNSA